MLIIKLSFFFFYHFWPGLSLKQTSVKMFSVLQTAEFSDEDNSRVHTCVHAHARTDERIANFILFI